MNQQQIASIEKIREFISGSNDEPIAVARVPDDIRAALSTSAKSVMLSRYTADKQKKHPEITADSFGFLQGIIDSGDRLYDKKHHATVIYNIDYPYVAVLKSTQDGTEVYLQSFRRSDAKNIASLKRRAGGG